MAKRKVVYEETYKAPGAKLGPKFLPVLPHVTDPVMEVAEAYVLKAGRYSDGSEFQNLHVVLREKK